VAMNPTGKWRDAELESVTERVVERESLGLSEREVVSLTERVALRVSESVSDTVADRVADAVRDALSESLAETLSDDDRVRVGGGVTLGVVEAVGETEALTVADGEELPPMRPAETVSRSLAVCVVVPLAEYDLEIEELGESDDDTLKDGTKVALAEIDAVRVLVALNERDTDRTTADRVSATDGDHDTERAE
jgi:hypothetical protein